MSADPPGRFRILTVCTGNICRSPAAEALLRSRLGDAVVTASAGTGARPGLPVAPEIAQLLADDGINAAGFASRRLDETMIREADLVLALAREHRSRVVSLVPAALRRTYTLKEFARLAAQVTPEELADTAGTVAERLRTLTVAAARHRGPAPAEADDIADPFGRSLAAYRAAYTEIVDAVGAIARTAGR